MNTLNKQSTALAPIVLFVYNRPWHTEQTLEALHRNILSDQSTLYVYADGAKSDADEKDLEAIYAVRQLIRSRQWCKEVILIERDINRGLADNIIEGVTEIVNKFGKVIVLEDDLVTSPGFLTFMNDALEMYKDDEQVMHVSGYMHPVEKKLPESFFYNAASCWGWGTWKRAWSYFTTDTSLMINAIDDRQHFDINGAFNFYQQLVNNHTNKIKTWAIKWHTSVYLARGLCLHPYPSLVKNIGHDGTGTHCTDSYSYEWDELADKIEVKKLALKESDEARDAIIQTYAPKGHSPSTISRILNRIKTILK